MINPIPHSAMFDTPTSLESLFEYIERFNGSERSLAMLIAMMTLNLAHHIVEQERVYESQN